MHHAYKVQILVVDLSKENYKTVSLPESILDKYIGGRGLGAKLYWDLISPAAGPLGAENLLMVLTGPLGGTMVLGSSKHLIVTKSPATGGWLESYSNGRVTPELKFAGYDGLIISGKAEKSTYITVKDNSVEFLDARNLWGKGAFEAETFMKKTFHPDCGCLSIGEVEAIYESETPSGNLIIAVDPEKCIECNQCVEACPFRAIEIHGGSGAIKCDLCGGSPTCVQFCNYGALLFPEISGEEYATRAKKIKELTKKIQDESKKYDSHERRLVYALEASKVITISNRYFKP